MNKHEREFDERQLQKRHRLGNDAFTMLALLLMADAVLYIFDVKWVPYPTNVFILLVICCGVFVVRAAWHGAFVGPRQSGAGKLGVAMMTAVISIGTALIISYQRKRLQMPAAPDGGSELLMLVSWSFLAVAWAVWLWKRHKEKREEQ